MMDSAIPAMPQAVMVRSSFETARSRLLGVLGTLDAQGVTPSEESDALIDAIGFALAGLESREQLSELMVLRDEIRTRLCRATSTLCRFRTAAQVLESGDEFDGDRINAASSAFQCLIIEAGENDTVGVAAMVGAMIERITDFMGPDILAADVIGAIEEMRETFLDEEDEFADEEDEVSGYALVH